MAGCSSGTGDEDLESRLRGMILSNSNSLTISNALGSESLPPTTNGFVPPHLRAENQVQSMKSNDEPKQPIQSRRRTKLTQAQKKKGASNRLDITSGRSSDPIHISPLLPTPRSNGQDMNESFGDVSRQPPKTQVKVTSHPNSRPLMVPQQHEPRPMNRQLSVDSAQSNGGSYMHQYQYQSYRMQQPNSFSQPVNNAYWPPYHRGLQGYRQEQQVRPAQAVQSLSFPQNQYARPPPPRTRQLYDPTGLQQLPLARDEYILPIRQQAEFIERLALFIIANAEPSAESLREQEKTRLDLEERFRFVVSAHELFQDPSFDPMSIKLKCYGSLSSGFATKESDMDLAFFSPHSNPDPASPESDIPRILEKLLLDSGFGARLLTRTRVPIIKFCEKPTPALLQSLIEERKKWEKIQNESPKGKHVSKTRPSKKKKPKKADAGEKSALQKRRGGLINSPSADNVFSSSDSGYTQPSNNHGSPVSVETEQRLPSSASTKERHPTTDTNTPQIEETDTKNLREQPVRTDEELVRLYLLAMHEDWFNDEERRIIYRFINLVKNTPLQGDQSQLDQARADLQQLPEVLSRYREITEKDNHLEFPKSGVGIQCDINFSNHLAMHNTLLLRCYSHCDPRIRPMVLFVKAWAKRRKINSPYHGTLSSYGYVLMVLHFVINIASPPLAPNLQLEWNQRHAGPIGETTCDGYDVRFWRSEKDIRLAASRGRITSNRETLGSLLRGFFHYFAQEGRGVFGGGFSWSTRVLSLRTHGGLLTKQEKGWTGARTVTIEATTPGQEAKEVKHRYLFAIEDPFEIDHNVARPVVHHGIVAIRDEFRRAHRIILNGGVIHGIPVDLFAEGTEHVQQRTFFGPNPARFQKSKFFGPQNLAMDRRKHGEVQQEKKAALPDGKPAASSLATPANVSDSEPRDNAGHTRDETTRNLEDLSHSCEVEVVEINGGGPDVVDDAEDSDELEVIDIRNRGPEVVQDSEVEAEREEEGKNEGEVVDIGGGGLEVVEEPGDADAAEMADTGSEHLEVVQEPEDEDGTEVVDIGGGGLEIVNDSDDDEDRVFHIGVGGMRLMVGGESVGSTNGR